MCCAQGPEDFDERDRELLRQDSGGSEWRDKGDRRDRRDSRERDVRDGRDLRDHMDRDRFRDRDLRDLHVRDPRDGRDGRDRDIRDRDRERDSRERDPRDLRERDRRGGRDDPRDRDRDRERDRDRDGFRDDHRPDRPQRPDSRDSRDSRTSRESRNSRDEAKMEGSSSWADASFDPHYDSKDKKHRDFYRDRREGAVVSWSQVCVEAAPARRRGLGHRLAMRPPPPALSQAPRVPGPVTQEKLLASERLYSATVPMQRLPGPSLLRPEPSPPQPEPQPPPPPKEQVLAPCFPSLIRCLPDQTWFIIARHVPAVCNSPLVPFAQSSGDREPAGKLQETWRSPPKGLEAERAIAEKEVGSKAWADQLAAADQTQDGDKPKDMMKDVDRITNLLGKLRRHRVASWDLTNRGPSNASVYFCLLGDKLDLNDMHGDQDDKMRDDDKGDDGKSKGGRRSGRGGRAGDQPRGGGGGGGGGQGSGSRRSGRSYGGRRSGRGRGGDYEGSVSEASGDEISVSTESGKEDLRGPGAASDGGKQGRRGPRSPKSRRRKDDKDRKDGDKDMQGPKDLKDGPREPRDGRDPRDSRDAPRDAARPDQSIKEGFAPRGEPSRRGRGGMGAVPSGRGGMAAGGPGHGPGPVGRRMDGYGPPPSKSPFGPPSDRPQDKQDESQGGLSLDQDGDKKGQGPALGAGVIGSGLRASGPPGVNTGPGKPGQGAPPGSGSQGGPPGPPGQRRKDGERKESSRRRDRDRDRDRRGNKGGAPDGAEEYDTVSSDGDDRHDLRNGGGRRGFREKTSGGPPGQPQQQPGRSGSGRRGGGGGKDGPGGRGGGEKRRDAGSAPGGGGGGGPSGRSGGGAPQTNGRSGGGRSGQGQGPGQGAGKTVAVNRVDEVKVNDPALVSQAITELSKKDKDKNNLEGIDLNNFASEYNPFFCRISTCNDE